MIYHFEGHSLDTARRELRRGEQLVALEPQVFDVLQYLLRHRGRVVSKDELVAGVWNNRVVSDSTLSSRISALRHALGDSGASQVLIRTMARKGLRFVAPVREAEALTEPAGADASLAQPTPALPSPRATGAERRQVTILACRIADAMALSARLDPEALHDVLADYRCAVAAIADEHGGVLAHDTGDGLAVHFGSPAAREDDAERAVRAGLALAGLRHEGTERAAALVSSVGIATGLVVIGAGGDNDLSARRAVVGATPLRALHLLERAEPGTVLVCPTTRRLVGGLFDCVAITPRNGAAAQDGVDSQVLKENAATSRFEALRPSQQSLIGRDEELALLGRRWQQVASGAGRVVLVAGEAGIGKSRLVAAFRAALVPPPPCWRFDCVPHRQQTALHPVAAQLERRAGFAPDDTGAVKRAKLERLLVGASRHLERDITLVAEVLGVADEARQAALAASAQRKRELLLECMLELLAAAAGDAPLLLILEDAHWIDPTSRELFDRIVERVRSLPVLLVVTYRPEFAAPWLGQSHVTLMLLNRLDAHDNAELVRQVAAGRALAPHLVEQIVARTDGVPLFVEELTKAVLEGGAVSLPATLQASLVARFDRLPAARTLVQTCAALGREFGYALLRAVMQESDAVLEPLLGQLVAAELVHQRGTPPHASYVFKHALVQDAAYETMLLAQRAAVHRRIVAAYDAEFLEEIQRHPDVLAHHCAAAGDWPRAIDARIRAARLARERSAGIEAQAQVEQAMALLPKIPATAERSQLEGRLQVAMGEALAMTSGFAAPAVMSTLAAARRLLDAMRYPLEALEALCGMFNYHLVRSESPAGLALAAPFLAETSGGPPAVIGNYLVGAAQLHLGDFPAAIAHLERALELHEEDACRPVAYIAGYHVRSFSLIWLGLALLYHGELRRASQTVAAAVNDARSRAHPFTLVSALMAMARFRSNTGDFAGAIEDTEEAARIATEQRSPYHQSRAAILRAVNLIDAGEAQRGVEQMQQALVLHRATGANFQSSYNLSRLAQAHALAGHRDQALACSTEALADVERSGERWWESEAQRIHGEILLAGGRADRDAARACFKKSLDCARRQDAAFFALRAALNLARLDAAKAPAAARALLAPIVARFEGEGEIPELREARGMLAGC